MRVSRYLIQRSNEIDLDSLLTMAAGIATTSPVTRAGLARALAPIQPNTAPQILAFVTRALLPLVQIPPRGKFRNYGPARYLTYESWIGRQAELPDTEALARRYLRAFGPATAADFAAWSGLTGTRELLARMEGFRRFRNQNDGLLYDLPGLPVPASDTPAGIRFLPALDNALLGYADRTRIVPAGYEEFARLAQNRFRGPILVDGFVAGKWSVLRGKPKVTMRIELVGEKSDAVRDEGLALLNFLEPDARSYSVITR
jgi:hypothetical protein